MTIEEERAICNAATPGPWDNDGPWSWGDHEELTLIVHSKSRDGVVGLLSLTAKANANADFIARARTMYPLALDVVEAAKVCIARNGWEGRSDFFAALAAFEAATE